jgi:hypothetical protein
MAMIDLDEERRRLAEFYSQQMDGELENVAKQGYALTDLAREALRAELSKRGLGVELTEARPVPPPPPAAFPQPGDPPPESPRAEASASSNESERRRMVTIRQIRDLPEALLAKGSLESAGIEALLTDDNTVRIDWFWSNLVGGIKLSVDSQDVEAAEEILEQPIPEGFDVSGVGEYQQPHCPNCQSLDVTYKELNRPVSYLTLWIDFPIPVYRRAWRCHDCDVEWEDDGVPGESQS